MTHFVFHLVHGTQFYLLKKPRLRWLMCGKPVVKWTKSDSPLCSNIRKSLEEKGHRVDFREIEWSGRNRHSDRSEAARRICESVDDSPTNARNILVAHSHGGNACMLALKQAEKSALERLIKVENGAEDVKSCESGESPSDDLPRRLAGIVCLSTPFLIIREAQWATKATIAWWVMLLLSVVFVASLLVDSFLSRAAIISLSVMILSFPMYLAVQRYKNWMEWSQSPMWCYGPVLIIRSPGDEASSGLGFVAILARALFLLEHKAAWPLRWLERHPVLIWLGASALMIAVAVASALLPDFGAWLDRHWKLLLLVLLGPLLIGLPLRIIVYGLAYGPDLLGLPMFLSISAETTPLGQWTTQLVEPPDSQERRSAHSEIYDLERVHDILVAWAEEATARKTIDWFFRESDGLTGQRASSGAEGLHAADARTAQ